MSKDKLGKKRICPTTGKKFYDLNKDPIISPYTGEILNEIGVEDLEKEKTEEITLENDINDKNLSKKKINSKLLSSWKLLELNPTANIEEVKKRYKLLAKKWHPDKNLKLKDNESDMFVKITNA